MLEPTQCHLKVGRRRWRVQRAGDRSVRKHSSGIEQPVIRESWDRVQAIWKAIDGYAELETGNREYFWNRPHSIG